MFLQAEAKCWVSVSWTKKDVGWIAVSPKATNSIAGGNATGFGQTTFSDPERVEFTTLFDPFRVGSSFALVSGGVATGY